MDTDDNQTRFRKKYDYKLCYFLLIVEEAAV